MRLFRLVRSVGPVLLLCCMSACPQRHSSSPDASHPTSDLTHEAVVEQLVEAEPTPPTPAPPADDGPGLGVVIATQLNVRADAGTAHRIKDTLRCGDIAYITGRKGAFYQVLLGDLSGYSHSAYIFRIGAGGLRPRCSRGAAARSEPDQPLAGKSKRQKVAPKSNPQQTVIAAAPDGDPEPVPSLGTPAPGHTTGAQIAATAASDKSAPASAQVGSTPAAPGTPVSAAAPRTAVKKEEPGPSKVLFAKDSTQVAPSEFPHHAHQAKFACAKCHHPVKRGSGGLSRVAGENANESKRCRDCHKDGSGDVKVALEDAMHRTCRDCHTAMGANMAPRAPRRCADCHKAE